MSVSFPHLFGQHTMPLQHNWRSTDDKQKKTGNIKVIMFGHSGKEQLFIAKYSSILTRKSLSNTAMKK